MTVLLRVALTSALVAALFPLAGCGEQIEEANAAVERANARIEEYSDLDADVAQLLSELDGLAAGPGDAPEALDIIGRIEQKLAARKQAASAARAEYEQIGELRVPPEVDTYAEKQVAALTALLAVDDAEAALVAERRALHEALRSGAPSQDELAAFGEAIAAKTDAVEKSRESFQGLSEDADRYFQQSGLGG